MSEETTMPLLTAADLMSRDVKTIVADTPLRDAAGQLVHCEVHGVPVVDDQGQCVGVLSTSDLARSIASLGEDRSPRPQTCPYQGKYREIGGRETVLCKLPADVCSFQRSQEMPDRTLAIVCTEPNCVPTEWQMVEMEPRPGGVVRDIMTTEVVTVDPDAPVPELARLMLDHAVHRLVVLDSQRRPIGLVTVDDLLQVLAHPEFPTTEGSL